MAAAVPQHSYFAHIASWGFILTLAALLAVDYWLEHTTIARRATLGGFDTASERVEVREAKHTAVVAISALEVEKYFDGRRPVPPVMLTAIVSQLLRVDPEVLIVDVFTDGPGYSRDLFSDSVIPRLRERVVWAQALDTTTSQVMPVLSGIPDPPGRTGLATILADDDRLVRRFRTRFMPREPPGAGAVWSLPFVATSSYIAGLRDETELTGRLPDDTGSIALRHYDRDPPFYLLDDVLNALPELEADSASVFANRVVVLGFVDGSDQVLTARGARAGPEVIADAIETLLDERGAIRQFPMWAEWLTKIGLALLVGVIHFRLSRRVAAALMVTLMIAVIYAGFLMFSYFGYWTNFVLIVVGMWIEQLYDGAAHSPPEAHT